MISEGNGRQDDAIRGIERKLIIHPNDFTLTKRLANAYTRAGNMQAAEQAYRNASRLSPDPAKYIEIITEAQASGLGWIGQPLPDFAEYSVGKTSSTYAHEVHNVRRSKSAVYQPTIELPNGSRVKRLFTFEENIRARVEDYETLTDKQGNPRTIEQRQALFRKWLSSCTGVAYKADSNKFKIIQISPQLADIEEGFDEPFIELKEGECEEIGGIELDRTEGIYNQQLTEEHILNNRAWNIAVPNKELLKAHAHIVLAEPKKERSMAFWLANIQNENQLRALVLGSLSYNSRANADWDLDSNAQSLRVVAQRQTG